MKKLILAAAILALTACTTAKQDDSYGAGFVTVNESTWHINNDMPYPFTTSGEISCGIGKFGREVYFEPEGFTDESYIGIPLNKTAVRALERDGVTSNVPDRVKTGVDLSEAIEIGLRVCDEQSE